jgi:WD repeat-containing protein 42A
MPLNKPHKHLAYSGDAAYLFSTLDDPTDSAPSSTFASSTGTPESKRLKLSQNKDELNIRPNLDTYIVDLEQEVEELEEEGGDEEGENEDENEDENDDEMEEEETLELEQSYHPNVPTIRPRKRFAGARNVDTVKDGKSTSCSRRSLLNVSERVAVNFLGPNDELVVSGSDDGNFFIWDKSTANLIGIYEGDGTVVNVIEGHPSLPLLAVSGIDTTVKVFYFTTPNGLVLLRFAYTALCPLKRTESILSSGKRGTNHDNKCTTSAKTRPSNANC